MMSKEDWEKFWAYLMEEYSIVVNIGSNRFDNVAKYLEWKRQEWLKWHESWPSELPAKGEDE